MKKNAASEPDKKNKNREKDKPAVPSVPAPKDGKNAKDAKDVKAKDGKKEKAGRSPDAAAVRAALKALRFNPARKPDLSRGFDPDLAAGPRDKKEGREWLRDETGKIVELQKRFYANGRHALLVVFQAMDTAGKDGVIRGVFGPVNPQGVRVQAFKRPTPDELAHDYLWRVHRVVPARGMIGVFNRSHYEDVLAGRVHKLAPEAEIERRYGQINAFEELLAENRVVIRKFFLHISADEQRERLQARLDDPRKHWKFDPNDLVERKLWDDYMRAYAKLLTRCNRPHAPWYVIPANRKWYRDWAVARILRETLESLDLKYPKAEFDAAAIKVR